MEELFGTLYRDFMAWWFAIAWSWDFVVILLFALIGYKDIKKDYDDGFSAWARLTDATGSNMTPNDFAAGKLVQQQFELAKIKLLLFLILCTLMMKL